MRNALDEFAIEGINTTIPLYKTIMEESNFIKGDLSTDYLDRFKIFDKMAQDVKERTNDHASAAVAAILMQSEFVKKAGSGQHDNPAARSRWKSRGAVI
jgi:acetyl-CoA/propionyl-CoA carboxylase